MPTVTYQTRVPNNLIPFCEQMSGLMSDVERHLYQDIQKGTSVTVLKREYQPRFGINARQFNSVYAVLKGKLRSRNECHKLQIKDLKSRISASFSAKMYGKRSASRRKKKQHLNVV